jgi:hypothetical protein
MLRKGESILGIGLEPRSIVLPRRVGRGGFPGAAHRSQGEERCCLAEGFFQPEIGLRWESDQPLGSIAVVRQCMTELVRELEAVLRPMGVAGGQADRDPAGRRPPKVRLRVVRTIIDIDSSELSGPAIPPKFEASRLQKQGEIGGTNSPKAVRLNPKIH